MDRALLEIENAQVYFPVYSGLRHRHTGDVKAVDDVSLTLKAGETLGLVGESGSGKTTLVNAVTMLQPLTAGHVYYEGRDLGGLSRTETQGLRAKMQIVFQDPFWSLNPRWLVRDIIGEPLKVHRRLRGNEYQRAVQKALEMVNLTAHDMFKYPHEFAGGLRQRLAIARALGLEPDLVVLDEPTSAIDVMSQHQILLMLDELKDRLGLTYILVSHDLSVVGYLATQVAVMYGGRLFEVGAAESVLRDPKHPYTRALIGSVPDPGAKGLGTLTALPGEVASALRPPPGCRFHPRCSYAGDICGRESPPKAQIGDGRYVYCWLFEEGADSGMLKVANPHTAEEVS